MNGIARTLAALGAAGLAAAFALALALAPAAAPASAQTPPPPDEWAAYGRDAGGTRYSPLADVDRGNVARLEPAWVHRTGDVMLNRGRFQATPLMVGGRVYVSSPLGRVSALDAADGRELWTFDPGVSLQGSYGDFANRGVAMWREPVAGEGRCHARVFIASIDARLFALDAATGEPCADFGRDGALDLTKGLRNPPARAGEYQVTSPPAVIGDLLVVGSAIADNQRVDAPSGVVRAFDVRSGGLAWAWDPVPQEPGDPAYATWEGPDAHRTGAANAWAPPSADPELGLVYVATSSPSPDFYGGTRLGRNDYANSVVALEAETGRVRWHFQVVHHDLWDYDIPAQPVLFPFPTPSGEVPAVAVATKMGHLFVLDRRSGEPLHPVEERPVPPSTVPGERAWPTQPFPVRPAPLVPQRLAPDDVFGATEEDRRWCRERVAGLRNEGIFTPPSLEGTLIVPGNIGGMHWGGVAVDPVRGVAVAPSNRLPFVVTLVPREEVAAWREGRPGAELSPQRGTPYAMQREVLFSPSGVPCNPPPWGALTAVDLVSGERLWEVPLGAFGPEGDPRLGAGNMGGALLTAGGLVFMAGTPDRTIRAFDVETGELLWSGVLPVDALATPMTYRVGGRQYVVVAAGGHDRLSALTGAPLGDHLVAFALPDAAGRRPGAAARSLEGEWRGELRAGDTRLPATLEVRPSGGALEARVRVDAPGVEGTASGGATDGAVALEGTFRIAAERCDGRVEMTGESANQGDLLVGVARFVAPCIDGGQAMGTFSFRRAR